MKTTRQPWWSGFAPLFAAIAVLTCQPSQSASVSEEDRAADRKELGALLERWEDAWNKHDMHALAALFHEDAVWVLWTGEVWTGRKKFEDGMVEVHKTVYANSIQRERLEELAFVGPDAAVMRFHSELTGDKRYPGKVVQSRKILVVTRQDGIWRIGWGQNTRFTERPPTR
jgi:uncharacterized protein (TIGR02246 family)